VHWIALFRFFVRTLASQLELTTSARVIVVRGGIEGGVRWTEMDQRSAVHVGKHFVTKFVGHLMKKGASCRNHNHAGRTAAPMIFS
jgi:hypothetical protein